MRVTIYYTVEVGDAYRRGIREYYGREGLATRQEVKDWFRMHGGTMDDEVAGMAHTTVPPKPPKP